MKDRRVSYVRDVLIELVESLDATVRIGRWRDEEGIPAPLRACSALLVDRLSKANRLAGDKFVGSTIAVAAISSISSAIRRLDLAFVAYRNAPGRAEAAIALEEEIARARSDLELAPLP
jgi:hypothetical protein